MPCSLLRLLLPQIPSGRGGSEIHQPYYQFCSGTAQVTLARKFSLPLHPQLPVFTERQFWFPEPFRVQNASSGIAGAFRGKGIIIMLVIWLLEGEKSYSHQQRKGVVVKDKLLYLYVASLPVFHVHIYKLKVLCSPSEAIKYCLYYF